MLLNDTEAKVDLLNFSATANAVAAMIRTSGDAPLSVGVSGDWGSGKSSLVRLIEAEIRRMDPDENEYVFIDFNAWLYQGFDDAKFALLQCVSDKLAEVSKNHEGVKDKVLSFLKRIDYLRTAKLALTAAGSAMAGGVLAGPAGAAAGLLTNLATANIKGVVSDTENLLATGEKQLAR